VSKDATMSVSDYVFNFLKNNITKGVWNPGEKIPSESKLCEILGVSRISVRTAISRLSSWGVLESRQGNGTFVCQLSSFNPLSGMHLVLSQSDRVSMFEYRKVIEVAVAEFAALRATTKMIDAMFETVHRMETDSNPQDIAQSDMEFHYLLAKSTNNSAIIQSFEILRDTYIRVFEENVALMGSFGVEYHRKILSAVETRNPVLARQYMSEHLDNTAARNVLGRSKGGPD